MNRSGEVERLPRSTWPDALNAASRDQAVGSEVVATKIFAQGEA